MTNNELAAFYRRYNACCNEHRFEDLAEFVARDVAIDGTDRGLDVYAAELQAVVRAFPDYRWELRRLVVDAPWIAAQFTDTGTHRAPFLGVQATGRSVAVPEFAFYRVDGGRIAEVWGSAFQMHFLNSSGSDVDTAARGSRGDRRGTTSPETEALVRSGPMADPRTDGRRFRSARQLRALRSLPVAPGLD
jgi:predicted ester cyclase